MGFGGFFFAAGRPCTMYYFFGTWSEGELASFESKEARTLNINALEMAITQHFDVYLGALPELGAPLTGQVIMPKCDNETETCVVLKGSYRARKKSTWLHYSKTTITLPPSTASLFK
jgi:hypothetical protein